MISLLIWSMVYIPMSRRHTPYIFKYMVAKRSRNQFKLFLLALCIKCAVACARSIEQICINIVIRYSLLLFIYCYYHYHIYERVYSVLGKNPNIQNCNRATVCTKMYTICLSVAMTQIYCNFSRIFAHKNRITASAVQESSCCMLHASQSLLHTPMPNL